jgi:hypothetical protein
MGAQPAPDRRGVRTGNADALPELAGMSAATARAMNSRGVALGQASSRAAGVVAHGMLTSSSANTFLHAVGASRVLPDAISKTCAGSTRSTAATRWPWSSFRQGRRQDLVTLGAGLGGGLPGDGQGGLQVGQLAGGAGEAGLQVPPLGQRGLKRGDATPQCSFSA